MAHIKSRANVTIREVAEKAGVSQMTVSRVLNQPSLVKQETIERVEEAIRDLNYRPNLLARGLAGGRSLFIGLFYNNPSVNYLGELLIGALNTCREDGHHLLVENYLSEADDFSEESLALKIRESGVDGLIVCPPLGEHPVVLAALAASGVPFVLVSPGDQANTPPYVMIDDRAAAQVMTNYLIERGHTRIAFIEGPASQAASGARRAGFVRALAENKVKAPPDYIVRGAFTYRSGMEAANTLLDLPEPPTAIFASNDDMAAGAVAAANQRGLRVPNDLSVAGFDDTPMARAIWPGLTTVRQPIAEMARHAVRLLGNDPATATPAGVILEVSIVERESVADLA